MLHCTSVLSFFLSRFSHWLHCCLVLSQSLMTSLVYIMVPQAILHGIPATSSHDAVTVVKICNFIEASNACEHYQADFPFIFKWSSQKSTSFIQAIAEIGFLGKLPQEFGTIFRILFLYAFHISSVGLSSWLYYMRHLFIFSVTIFNTLCRSHASAIQLALVGMPHANGLCF